MKTFIAAALLSLGFGLAHAETITFAPANCAATKVCVSVPNDTGATISIYAEIAYPKVYLIIDGLQYFSPTGNAYSIVGLQLSAADGSVAILNADFTSGRVCNKSGRGQSCHLVWTLIDGSVSR